jgi:hypothetical protein
MTADTGMKNCLSVTSDLCECPETDKYFIKEISSQVMGDMGLWL